MHDVIVSVSGTWCLLYSLLFHRFMSCHFAHEIRMRRRFIGNQWVLELDDARPNRRLIVPATQTKLIFRLFLRIELLVDRMLRF